MTWAGATRRVVEAEGEGVMSGSNFIPFREISFIITTLKSSRNMRSCCNPCRGDINRQSSAFPVAVCVSRCIESFQWQSSELHFCITAAVALNSMWV